MAPYQCPKQVLIWSLPTLAVLISLFWYRRRRPSLKSDPGGTAAEQASIGDHPSISRTAGQLLNAIEKARRDLETSQPIAEVEEVRTVELSNKEISVKQTSKVVENQQILEKISVEKIACEKPVKNQQITDEISVKQITSDKAVENQPIIEKISVEQIACEKSDKVVKNKQIPEEISVKQITCKTSDKVVENHPVIEKISVEQIACGKSKAVASQQPVTGANTSTTNQKQIIKSVAEKSSDEVRQDSNCSTDKICERKVVESGVVKEGKVEESDKSGVQDSVENCVKVSKKPVEEVQIQKQEVVELKKDREQPKMALDIKEQQRQQDELSVDRKMELSNESHDDGERDSANHSPAEIMLESPALSNFSDAHSEGSSDSGKGCSDVATPPAGGSSVSEEAEVAEAAEAEAEEAGSDAGAEAFGVYEFIIPQHLVGRLIGRHGAFLQEIRGTTHTNLFIKRHPDTNKLKICAVEGAQADIDAALSMIRHKFPLRRYPTLTLEKVTFVQVAPTCELAPEQFRLQLVEGVNNDVILSSLVSAGHMFLQQPTHPSFQQLAALNQVMNANYCYNDSPSLEEPVKDGVCAAPAPMGGWFRAQIVAVNDDEKTVELRFLDYGGYLSCEYTILKKMRYDFLLLPFQAVECCLANVTPTGGPGAVWSEEATLFVQNLIYGKILQAQIYDYTEEGMPLIYLYATCGNQVVLVNQELVANGFAEPVTPPQAQETQQQETKVIEE